MTKKVAITVRQMLEGISARLDGLEIFVNNLADERERTLSIQRVLADHVKRLVREKEILQNDLAAHQWREANTFMSERLRKKLS